MTAEPTIEPAANAPSAGSRWARLRRRSLRLALVLGLIVVGLVLAHRPLLVGYSYLFLVDNPVHSDALVLLHGGPGHRPAKVVELYREGLSPLILMGETGVLPVLEVDEAEQIRSYLVRNGVPPGAIRILPGGVVTSTADEAIRVRDFARSHPLRRITLVTTAFHTARARWIFRKLLHGQVLDVRAAAARKPEYDESNWYRTEPGLIDYFEETIKTLRYRVLWRSVPGRA